MNHDQPPRRDFLRYVGTMAALTAPALHAAASEQNRVSFPPIFDKSEKPEQTEPPGDSWNERVGIAIVGLGRIAINEMLPAFEQSKHAKVTALITGDREKGLKVAQEPSEVIGNIWSTPGDARFREVEESCQFILRFPSGFMATCSTSYSAHKSQMFRLNGATAWAEMDPGYAYHGNKLRIAKLVDGTEQLSDIQIKEKNQFALMIDHFAECIQQKKNVHTPGEEGLQDQRIMEAIYESARTRRSVKLKPPGQTRGPEPKSDSAS